MKKYIYTTHYNRRTFRPQEDDLNTLLDRIAGNESGLRKRITVRNPQNNPHTLRHPEVFKGIQKVIISVKTYYKQFLDSEEKHLETYTFQIPKKSGGTRTIVAPHHNLKAAHQRILFDLQKRFKILEHNNAFAYVNDRSTKEALKVHQANESKYFLKVDISDFFGSCSKDLLLNKLPTVYPFNYMDKDVLEILVSLATLDGVLPQGMPLSPFLTNMIMVPFDHEFSEFCKRKKLIYTRYADDLLISSVNEFEFEKVIRQINKLFKNLEYPFKIKEDKTRFGTREGRNWNLGLMLNKDNKITIGHERKKNLKVILYKLSKGEISSSDHIRGVFSYLKQIEPDYFEHLNRYSLRVYNASIKTLIS